MSSSQTDSSSQPDLLSNLPDVLLIVILSFLPTRIAARTSVLSRRFRHLWKACPAVDLSVDSVTNIRNSKFEAMANSALLSRDPSNPLLSLHLRVLPGSFPELRDSCLSSLLAKAHSLGLRHLNMAMGPFHELDPLTVSIIFSIDSLQSLHLPSVPPGSLPSVVNLPGLKTLSLTFDEIEDMAEPSDSDDDLTYEDYSPDFNRFLSQIVSLEDLHLRLHLNVGFTLTSQTIRKLDLFIDHIFDQDECVRLSMPSLEILRLETSNTDGDGLPRIVGIMPSLRKADLQLRKLHKGDVSVVAQLLSCVSGVEELRLDIVEDLVISSLPLLLLFNYLTT